LRTTGQPDNRTTGQPDQMTQAARSGRANIVEGSERSATSKSTEMRLTDVAKASLGELKSDFEFWLLSQKKLPWKQSSTDLSAIRNIQLDPNSSIMANDLHEADKYILAQYAKFSFWLESDNPETVANAMLILLSRVLYILQKQITTQGEAFKQEGGFRERMNTVRIEERDKKIPTDAPTCPECGKKMRKCIAKAGQNAGNPFWGCTGFPDCKGIKNCE
jgi:restriction system protein